VSPWLNVKFTDEDHNRKMLLKLVGTILNQGFSNFSTIYIIQNYWMLLHWDLSSTDSWVVSHALCINLTRWKIQKLQSYMPNSIGSRTKILCTSCLEDVSIFVNEMSFTIIVDCSGMRETRLPKSTILYSVGEPTAPAGR